MEEKNKTGRGGKRPGAGRPKTEPTIVVAARVKLSTEAKLKSLATKQQTTCSDIIEQLINKEPT